MVENPAPSKFVLESGVRPKLSHFGDSRNPIARSYAEPQNINPISSLSFYKQHK